MDGASGAVRLSHGEASNWSTATQACLAHCAKCARCRFITVGLKERDCSWYHSCSKFVAMANFQSGTASAPVTSRLLQFESKLRSGRRPRSHTLATYDPFDAATLACPAGCPGFPKLAGKQPLPSTTNVLLVIAAYEAPAYVRLIVENALLHTDATTTILLHLNAHSEYDPSDGDFRFLASHPRVLLSCLRIQVATFSLGVFAAQAASVQWARCVGLQPAFIVFQASNMAWVRRGMEAHVQRWKASTPAIRSAAECAAFQLSSRRASITSEQYCYILERARDPAVAHGCPQASCQKNSKLPSAAGVCCGKWAMSTRFQSPPDPCVLPPFPSSRVNQAKYRWVVQTKHEGSFYPTDLVYAAIDALRGLEAAHFRETADKTFCTLPNHTWLQLPSTFLRTPYWIEEVIFQTFAANEFRGQGMWAWTSYQTENSAQAHEWDTRVMAALLRPSAFSTSANYTRHCHEVRRYLQSKPHIFALKYHDLREATMMGERHRMLTLNSVC